MSPPIRDGSGSSIGAIRLGDGTEISEVRTGAGDVLFSATTIPDSAIHHYPTSGNSPLQDDIGFINGSINGATYVTNTWVDNNALDYDGVNDNVDFGTTISEISYSENFSIALTIEPDDVSSDGRILEHVAGSSDRTAIIVDSGDVRAGYYDGSSYTGVSGGVSTGNKYRIFWAHNSNGSNALWINNSQVSGTSTPNAGPTTGWHLGDSPNGGQEFDGRIDNVLIMDAEETSDTVENDYNRQPWS